MKQKKTEKTETEKKENRRQIKKVGTYYYKDLDTNFIMHIQWIQWEF